MLFTSTFWKAAAERAIKTFAQSLIALLGIDKTNLIHINWVGALSAAGLATLISVLTSIASGAKDGNPSATNSEVARPAIDLKPTTKVDDEAPPPAPAGAPAPAPAPAPVVPEVLAPAPAAAAAANGTAVAVLDDAPEPEIDTDFDDEPDDQLVDPLADDVPEPADFDDGTTLAGARLS